MKKTVQQTFSLVVGALLLGTAAGAKDQVTRSTKWSGQNIVAVDFSTGSWWIEEESGEGSHVGRYTCEGGGTFTATGIVGEGSLVAANGDRIYFEMSREGDEPTTFTITGGTGRFEDASGVWTGESTEIEQVWVGPLLYLHHISEGTGTLTY